MAAKKPPAKRRTLKSASPKRVTARKAARPKAEARKAATKRVANAALEPARRAAPNRAEAEPVKRPVPTPKSRNFSLKVWGSQVSAGEVVLSPALPAVVPAVAEALGSDACNPEDEETAAVPTVSAAAAVDAIEETDPEETIEISDAEIQPGSVDMNGASTPLSPPPSEGLEPPTDVVTEPVDVPVARLGVREAFNQIRHKLRLVWGS
jgi:hypothetical protein